MKKIRICLLTIFAAATLQSFAQQVNINILAVPESIPKGETGYIQVDVCNVDAFNLTAPANKLRPLISVPGNVTITGVTDVNGNPLTGFNVLSQSTSSVRLLATEPLPPFECFSFRVVVQGATIGASDVVTGTLGFQGPPTIGDNPADNNSTSGVAVTTPLPVTLTSFTASKENSTTLLKWATTMETNSDHFEIEKSLNGKNWGKIGSVASHGESNSLKDYSYVDANPFNGENLYRLRMVDKDNTFAYSTIRSIVFDGTGADLSVYPNPTVDVLKIKDFSQVTKVSIFDMNGRAVLESGATTTGEINVRNLTSGMYLVRVSRANGLTSSQKIVVGK
jgi:hypothetical protein